MILQLIPGGQTSGQRAALDAALERNVPCGECFQLETEARVRVIRG